MNVTLLLMSFLNMILIISFSSLTSGQGVPQPEYKTYVVDKCGVSLAYPSNWISEVKTGRFDIEHMDESVVKDGLNGVPQFSVLPCDDSVFRYMSLETMASALRNTLVSSYNAGFETSLVDDVHIVSSLIDGQDTAVFALAVKYTNGVTPNTGIEIYVTLHNNSKYAFSYYDFATDFDSTQSKNIRDKILQSIKFIR